MDNLIRRGLLRRFTFEAVTWRSVGARNDVEEWGKISTSGEQEHGGHRQKSRMRSRR